MADRWRQYFKGHQGKLLLSIGSSFLTRFPGVIGLLWFLPLLHLGLGTDGYAALLSAMAMGSSLGFLASGFNLVGRRQVGCSFSVGDHAGEADGFVKTIFADGLAISLTLAIVVIYCWLCGLGATYLFAVAVVVCTLFLGVLDDMRVAYNEHYVTALLFVVIQSAAYAIGLLVPATRQSIIIAVLVLQGPFMAASLITGGMLVRERPYLLMGRPTAVWSVLRQGAPLAVADGLMMAVLGFAVVWLQASDNAAISAWFGTTVRLFQTFLVPVILLLIPLSSYIRIHWNGKTLSQQQALTKATLLIGFAYGAFVAIALYIVSRI